MTEETPERALGQVVRSLGKKIKQGCWVKKGRGELLGGGPRDVWGERERWTR